jgi:hypothetical protein
VTRQRALNISQKQHLVLLRNLTIIAAQQTRDRNNSQSCVNTGCAQPTTQQLTPIDGLHKESVPPVAKVSLNGGQREEEKGRHGVHRHTVAVDTALA